MELVDPNHHLICVSRSESTSLKIHAGEKKCKLDNLRFDLSQTNETDALMESIFCLFNISESEGIYLINNAGVINPVGPSEENPSHEVEQHIKINLIAPMLITAGFIRLTYNINVVKRIINISSGAALLPYYGWSSYCTGKAGLDMYTRCIATEQQRRENPVEIMSVAPGIIDTPMQETIRNVPEEKFIHKKKFIEYKEKGKLISPKIAGKKIKTLLLSKKFKNGELTDLGNE